MKKIIFSAILISTAPAAMADDVTGYCTAIGSLAKTVMTQRQRGVTAMDMHNALSEGASPLAAAVIESAFEEPRYSTDSYRSEAIAEFTSQWFMACMKVEREEKQ